MLPLTTTQKHIPLHVEVSPTETGLKQRSFVKCEDIRSLSRERLSNPCGTIRPQAVALIEDRVRMLLGL